MQVVFFLLSLKKKKKNKKTKTKTKRVTFDFKASSNNCVMFIF